MSERAVVHRDRSLHAAGFTLIELMVTVAVVVILLVVAVPSFNNATLGGKLASYANSLAASAYLARSEAMKRNAAITLCASSDGTSCAASGGWDQGWIVMCPSDDAVTCTSGGAGSIVFQRQAALAGGLKVIEDGVARSLTFPPTGIMSPFPPAAMTGTLPTLTFCRGAPVGHQERVVSITATGGASVTRTTTGSCSG
jgi:type IV fimbrial biogenesis protein FimT